MSYWVEWTGGNCPVDRGTRVDVLTRGGGGGTKIVAASIRWGHADHPEDVLRYRVSDDQPANPEGWIEWTGGECPVPHDTLVEARFRNGEVSLGPDAACFWWGCRGDTHDIVAYRVVQPAEQPVSRGGVGAVETLRRAADLIEQRGKQRDSDTGERSMARTVAAFNAVYGASLTETQGWHFMELLKMARSSQGCYVADDFDDKVAYAALAAECEAGARGRTD